MDSMMKYNRGARPNERSIVAETRRPMAMPRAAFVYLDAAGDEYQALRALTDPDRAAGSVRAALEAADQRQEQRDVDPRGRAQRPRRTTSASVDHQEPEDRSGDDERCGPPCVGIEHGERGCERDRDEAQPSMLKEQAFRTLWSDAAESLQEGGVRVPGQTTRAP